ncbi:class III lanthionine synthetase LanKC [Priestia aryabhattai]|uniref:class III lanthionine synthetase LanKC n=2 Tax=Priestia aryabhattai TaxID=412384 RepID=UPI002659A1F6|nr:class III lanthionine synthetase LanKC [Priestia aryabhattai]WKG33419.1 class III lanthionine synthetase LanKC [Priestia aryabhattai]
MMDHRYIKYLNEGYYYNVATKDNQKLLKLNTPPKGYAVIDGEHWVNVLVKNEIIPNQGWKIHISTNIEEAQKTLDIVSKVLMDISVSFKYVKSITELLLKDSKYSDRGSSGKFITIYPKNDEQFIYLLNLLEENISHLRPGPYILNDKRWYNSNIYFRYGAFMPRYFYKDGEKVDAIEDLEGKLIEDKRVPYYYLPDFVQEPTEITKMDKRTEEFNIPSPLDNFEIEEAIHFSNGGGVYIANNQNNKKIILKEGRPHTALDAQGIDAFSRIMNESNVLDKLSNTTYPVKKISSFHAWEHYFIEEEYIEGDSLSSWQVREYPFSSSKKDESYTESCINIISQLIEALKEIHANNVGMGDLQPANVIITPDEKVRLIDFETASTTNDALSGLMTPGYIGSQEMNKEQSDWFALLRIARQLFVPIGSVQDISWNMDTIHNDWVKTVFGERAINVIKEVESICEAYQSRPMNELLKTNGHLHTEFNLPQLKLKLRNSIFKDLLNEDRLLPGDIRQYEMEFGSLNVLTGGFGTAMALHRTGGVNNKVKEWVKKQDIVQLLQLDNGLFTGKLGIATVLWELGYIEKAQRLFDSTIDLNNIEDISIASGLSGIGLAYLGLTYELNDKKYLEICLYIGELLKDKLDSDAPIIPFDYDVVNKGVMTSWSGVSLYFTALYKKTEDQKWLLLSEEALEKDLKLGLFDDDGLYQIDDDFRILPYLAGGGSGLAIPMIEFEKNTKVRKWNKEIEGICKIPKSKTFYNAGLFQGTTGILAIANLLELYTKEKELVNSALFTLNLHLLEFDDCVYVPGDSCFRISGDLMSGSAGLLLTVNDILEHTNYSWLPILNLEEVISSSSFKGGEGNE